MNNSQQEENEREARVHLSLLRFFSQACADVIKNEPMDDAEIEDVATVLVFMSFIIMLENWEALIAQKFLNEQLQIFVNYEQRRQKAVDDNTKILEAIMKTITSDFGMTKSDLEVALEKEQQENN